MGMIINPYRFGVAATPVVIDSNPESNYNYDFAFGYSGSNMGRGMSFECTVSKTLDSCKFYLKKVGTPTGDMYAKLWGHTGTYGTDSKPTGSALAVSDVFSIADLTTSFQLITFNFSGVNRIALSANYYVITLSKAVGDDTSNYINIGGDSSPSHGGNSCSTSSELTWTSSAIRDVIFYVYGV